MENKDKYEYTYNLRHNEKPAFVNLDTGTVAVIDNKLPVYTGATVFNQKAEFFKSFSNAWEWMYYRVTPLELKVALYLAMKATPVTNSLEPLGDDSSVRELAAATDISTGKVTTVFKNLLEIGVFAKFEVVEEGKKYTRYWVLNPHLSIKSKVVKDTVVKLFENTELSKAAMLKRE